MEFVADLLPNRIFILCIKYFFTNSCVDLAIIVNKKN